MGSSVEKDIIMQLFEEVRIWRRNSDNSVACYYCFKDIERNRFCVQSSDFFYETVDHQCISESNRQLIELLIEQSPRERCCWYDSISEAIEAHDLEFTV